MKNLPSEKTPNKFFNFKTIVPLSRGQGRAKIKENTNVKPIDKISNLNLLQSIGRQSIELSFSSISDVSMEFVEMHDNSAKRNMKVLLLTVTNDNDNRNFYLIDINSLVSNLPKVNIEVLPEREIDFENLYHMLSLREQRVLHEVSLGKTSNEIASKFFISTNTVKNHRKNIKKKLQFDDNQDYSKFLKWSLDYCGEALKE